MTRVSSRSLKLAGALGAVVVCGAAGVAVAADTTPAAAPVRPPVDPAATLAGAAAATASSAAGGDSLVIPPSSVCTAGTAGTGARTRPAGPVPTPDPAIAAAVAQIRAATTKQQRQSILMQLPAGQRMQVTAYLQLLTRPGTAGSCSASNSGGASMSSAPVIVPSVVTGGPDATPAVVSAVS
jgi:hypothetical protein